MLVAVTRGVGVWAVPPSAGRILREILEGHLRVGPRTLVSYPPIGTIEDVIGISVEAYVAPIKHAGHRFAVFHAE